MKTTGSQVIIVYPLEIKSGAFFKDNDITNGFHYLCSNVFGAIALIENCK